MPEEGKVIDKSLLTLVVQWVVGQPFNNVLLLAIFIAIGYIGYYGAQFAQHSIPAHLKQIQAGYEEIEKSNREERDKARVDSREERKETMQMYDKWHDIKLSTSTTP